MRERFLVVDRHGVFLGKHSERLRVSRNGQVLEEVPLLDLEQVLVLGNGVALSSDAVRACTERGIPIAFLSPRGRVYARVVSPEMGGTVRTRREQVLAYLDRRGLHLARCFAVGKMRNQANLLKYMGKYRKERRQEAFRVVREAVEAIEALAREVQALEGASVEEVRPYLLSLEGRAGEWYWDAVKALLPPEVGFPGRETRGARDPVNRALNYGYGILYSQVEQAVLLAGLDPYAGFVHTDRSGRPSLVLDLMEEFRQAVVDRAVFALLNLRVPLETEEDRSFTPATRRLLAERVLERLESPVPYEGRRCRLRTVLQSQARHLATFVRGEGRYRPFVAPW